MPAALRIYSATCDPSGIPLADLTPLPPTDTSQPGAPLDLLVRNEGDETAREAQLRLLARLDAASPWQPEGLPPLDEGWIEVSLDGGPWLPLGAGRLVWLPDLEPSLESGEEVAIQLRQNPPPGTADHLYQYELQALTGAAVSLPGIELPHGSGVVLPFHDSSETAWWEEPKATPGAGVGEVDITEWAWFAHRRFWAKPAATLVLDDLDANGDPLAVGEEYISLLSATPDGTVTVTKGVKGTALDETARPPIPTSHLPAFWATRDDTGTLTLTPAFPPPGFFAATVEGTTLRLGQGAAILAGRGPIRRAGQEAGLPPNATSTVWLLPLGGHAVTQADQPPAAAPGALPLYRATTDATSVTDLVDLRRWVGARFASVDFHLEGELTVGAIAYGTLPPGRWHLLPTGALRVFLEDAGAGTSGATVFDVEVRDSSGQWGNLFPTQMAGVSDHGESVAFDGVESLGDGRPEVLTVDGPALLRLRVAQVPEGAGVRPGGGWGRSGVWG
jgi:hypothetical protein